MSITMPNRRDCRGRATCRCVQTCIVLGLCSAMSAARAQDELAALGRLSLEELGMLPVTSVAREPTAIREAPAAIYVITREDILRSGATSLPEALRLAPTLLVTQLSSGGYALSSRGLSGNLDVQSFSNKLLVLIDGRSVYSPLFSGVYADAQDVMLEDVERIEVISGPGATLWGANAMNGVVNVITRSTVSTQGSLATLGLGNREQHGSLRHGGRFAEAATYRVYGKAFARGETETPDGLGRNDDWFRGQGGFRIDGTRGVDDFTVQGDAYRGKVSEGNTGWLTVEGANLLSRWQRATTTGALQVQAYVDQTTRDAPGNSARFTLRTYDLEAQQTLDIGSRQRVVWGGGVRLNDYAVGNSEALAFVPDERSLAILNVFAQDTVSLGSALDLTLGIKLEDHTYTDWVVQPDVRLAWRATPSMLVWTALSRAIRATTPFDRDVVERIGGQTILRGNRDFEPETVTAWELGYRAQLGAWLHVESTLFVHDYDDLRTVEPGRDVPLTWENGLGGRLWGVQAWARIDVTDWWRLSPGVTLLRHDLEFDRDAVRLVGTRQAGNDPSGHGTLTSSMNFGDRLSLDATVRHVGRLRDPEFPAWTELSARLGWRPTAGLELSVNGFNLLHDHHGEYPAPQGAEIGRSLLLQARWWLP